jgi:hypothetical protein
MKITIPTKTTEEAVNAINKKLGTHYTVFDYAAWESGIDNEGTRRFASSVEQYVGSFQYGVVTRLALAALKIKRLFRRQ